MSTQPEYASYQANLYLSALSNGVLPLVTTDPNKLEEQAREHMSSRSYGFVGGAAGERATLAANRLAFRQWRLIPRHMKDISTLDTSVNLLGQIHKSPLLLAPIGVQKVYHEDGELGMASVARELKVSYIMSTAASTTIEEVAAANGDGNRWFQLYWPRSDQVTISLLQRAKQNGFTALVVTLDTVTLAWRPWDLDLGFSPFLKGVGSQVGVSDPAFRKTFQERHGRTADEDPEAAVQDWLQDALSGKAHTWEDLKFLRKHWQGPILLKGIQHVEDARLAVEAGVEGIIVSNHGGRQLDGAVGSLEVLPEIAEAVGDQITILFDSGIRTGSDILKALSLGAKAVLLGRPWVYGLGIGGQSGAKSVIQGILADLEQSMRLSGIKSVSECQRSNVRKVQYGGDGTGLN